MTHLGEPAFVTTRCPVCAHTQAMPFYDGEQQTLATLGWPRSVAEAQAMPRYPHTFVHCPACTHVWNPAFRYETVPYKKNPNRMFNHGGLWKGHLARTRDALLRYLPDAPTVIEIGCGEGHFVRGLAEARNGDGRFIGFDPNVSAETGRGLEFHARLFEPPTDLATYAPDAIVTRHVLEHLTDPAELLEQLAWAAASLDKPCYLFAEAPCIDRVFETGRIADFFYEHVSHFTTESFRTLLRRSGDLTELTHGYNGEVVYGVVRLSVPAIMRERAQAAWAFNRRARASRARIRAQLDALAQSGSTVVIWGGTGKAAAFMHQFGADAERFPLVVDSDAGKAGTFVPGTGQEIVHRDALKGMAIDAIIIPTQWRAMDIAAEMRREGIHAGKILIEHSGRLVDFLVDEHPYR